MDFEDEKDELEMKQVLQMSKEKVQNNHIMDLFDQHRDSVRSMILVDYRHHQRSPKQRPKTSNADGF